MALRKAKEVLRLQMKQKLKHMPLDIKCHQSELVYCKLLQNSLYLNSQRISIYLSRNIEVDTKAILLHIFNAGKDCYIPKYDSKTTYMDMVKLDSVQEYEKLPMTPWNIKQPDDAPNLINALSTGGLDLIIVPGIAFTKDGHRLGNGKGYYDVYLRKYESLFGVKAATLSLAFKEQIVPFVPTGETDVLIDEVIFPD